MMRCDHYLWKKQNHSQSLVRLSFICLFHQFTLMFPIALQYDTKIHHLLLQPEITYGRNDKVVTNWQSMKARKKRFDSHIRSFPIEWFCLSCRGQSQSRERKCVKAQPMLSRTSTSNVRRDEKAERANIVPFHIFNNVTTTGDSLDKHIFLLRIYMNHKNGSFNMPYIFFVLCHARTAH